MVDDELANCGSLAHFVVVRVKLPTLLYASKTGGGPRFTDHLHIYNALNTPSIWWIYNTDHPCNKGYPAYNPSLVLTAANFGPAMKKVADTVY